MENKNPKIEILKNLSSPKLNTFPLHNNPELNGLLQIRVRLPSSGTGISRYYHHLTDIQYPMTGIGLLWSSGAVLDANTTDLDTTETFIRILILILIRFSSFL